MIVLIAMYPLHQGLRHSHISAGHLSRRAISPSPPACGGRGRGPVAAAAGRVRWATPQPRSRGSPTSPRPSPPPGAEREDPISFSKSAPRCVNPVAHQGGEPLSALLFVLPPPRWGRVGVGVMRAECVDPVENRSNRQMRRGGLRRSALSGSRCNQPQIIASAHAENFTYKLHSGPRRFSASSLTTSIGLAAALS
jgi:hypothetical protein